LTVLKVQQPKTINQSVIQKGCYNGEESIEALSSSTRDELSFCIEEGILVNLCTIPSTLYIK